MIRTGLFRFVRWDHIDAFHRRGWMVTCVLGDYSVLCWGCSCAEFAALNPGDVA